ncbi:MAG: stage III sporulation protein AB [Clostridia bacterium]|nr:stage III sporulation protein AB [Clostridia bacterium]
MGSIILALSITATGFYAAAAANKRVKLLECCIGLIRYISLEIDYCSETVFTIIEKASVLKQFEELTFLKEIDSSKEADFSFLWSDAIDRFLHKSYLKYSDAELLKSFGEKLGTTDSFHQTQLCVEYIKQFEECYEKRKGKLPEHIRLCKVGGVTIGLAVLIILL